MDHGQPPEPKRQRTQPWAREHPPPSRELPLPEHDPRGRELPLPVPKASTPTGRTPFSNPISNHHNPLDRRPPEHNQYDPESRRPSSGPHMYHNATPHNHHNQPYGARPDIMVKRDTSEDAQIQYNQASPGGGLENPLSAHHERQHIPQYDPTHSANYRPAPPPPYLSHPPPQSPMAAHEAFNPNYSSHGLPPPQSQYGNVSYPPAGVTPSTVKRKAQRAAQACDSCRTLKAKCDEGRPSCLSCKEKGMVCQYRDPPPKQQDKTSSELLEGMQRVESIIQGFQGTFKEIVTALQGKLNDVSTKVDRLDQEFHSKDRPLKIEEGDQGSDFPAQITRELSPRPSISGASQDLTPHIAYQPQEGRTFSSENVHREQDPETEEEDTGEVVNIKNETVIPLNHTTGQARLLLVAPIKELALEVISTRKYEKYPMLEEQKRGCLRLFGRGEGTGRSPPYEKDSLENHGAENTPSDTGPDPPSPPGEEWGQLGGLSPPAEDNSHYISRGTVIGRDGMPDLRPAVVHRLVESYKAHVNLLHPILVPHVLEELVDGFLRSIPESSAKSKQVRELAANGHGAHAGFVGSHRNPESPGNKRKRSPVSGQDYDMPNIREHKPGHPFRDIDTALVLAVMALGAICEHKGKLPNLASDKPVDQYPDSPLARNGIPRSPVQSSPMMVTPPTLPSPLEGGRSHSRSRRTSLDGPINPRLGTRPKNIDVLPGLAYFALATDIIGNQLGGITLKHVHVNILAGLYHGQLGRILESEAYISKACLTLEHLIKPKIARFKKLKDEFKEAQSKDNKYIIAFWTCLQLESDIIAELDCPYPGILRYEELLPLPSASAAIEVGIPFEVIKAYNQQLLLRKHLNQLHGMFYRPSMSETELNPEDQELNNERQKRLRFRTLEAMETSLNEIRKGEWTDDDPPANDILEARLRAKFYGARVISYRTYVTQILELPAMKDNKSRNATISDHYKNSIAVPQVNENATELSDLDPKYIEYAQEGIKALIKSTTAFYNLGDPGSVRLLVTNIWGTAHAQFGNVLTLLGVCKDPILGELVNIEELRTLVETTLRFLKLHSQPTSAIYTDFLILENAARKTGMLPSNWASHLNVSSSFSSSSRDTPMGY